ncbi:MAG TPA: enoyl-CoA hydratase/isomerase family protein [Ramlibacter sp.]|nr:enoyl-CoA hydratase/isomerase family protein [Ramlibacter sp.]
MNYEAIKFDVRPDGIATMTLNRPKNLNCFSQQMFAEWRHVVERVAYDRDIKVLVITGEGRAFSSGVDLNVLGSEKLPHEFRFYYRQNHRGFDDLEALEKPVIAAINGICFGGGVELSLSCDILFAADNAKFCLAENQLGCIPATGACNRMIAYVGLAKTKELVMAAEPIDAEEAWRIGLVNHVVPANKLLDEVYAYAERMIQKSPMAMGMGKHIINLCLNTDMHTGRYLERLGQSCLVQSEDHREGMAAFFEGRKPVFKGR